MPAGSNGLDNGNNEIIFCQFSFPSPPLLGEYSLWTVFENSQGCIKDTKLYNRIFPSGKINRNYYKSCLGKNGNQKNGFIKQTLVKNKQIPKREQTQNPHRM